MARSDSSNGLVVVTGGSGFIGHSLIRHLLANGYRVRNIDLKPSRLESGQLSHWPGSFQDRVLLSEALVEADTVYHLAATRFPREANRDPAQDARENIVGTLGLLDAAVERGVRRFVFCSSGGTVYGLTPHVPIREDHPTNPISAYGVGKLAIEKYLRIYAQQHGIGTVALRIANPYGPLQNVAKAQGALTTFCVKAVRDEEIEIWGDGTVRRDYIHVEDVALALLTAAENSVSGQEINIGSGVATSLGDLVRSISAQLGRAVRHRHFEGRTFDVPFNVLDIGLADRILGWRPQVPLERGIEELLAHIVGADGQVV